MDVVYTMVHYTVLTVAPWLKLRAQSFISVTKYIYHVSYLWTY